MGNQSNENEDHQEGYHVYHEYYLFQPWFMNYEWVPANFNQFSFLLLQCTAKLFMKKAFLFKPQLSPRDYCE